MSAGKILWGQILAASVTALAFVWAGTQWTAWRLGFQPGLGPAWFEIGTWPIYPPPAFFLWWYWYDAYAPRVFVEGAVIAAMGGFVTIAVAIAMSLWRAREDRDVATYGSARWAEEADVRKAGLLAPDGVVLGRWDEHYLRHDGPEHVLCFAPTRSGKGVGLVVPTLLTWPGSAIVHDVKGENWQLTAGWRARTGRVLRFDPTDAASAAYNPLLEVRRGPSEVRDVQNIADILVDPDGSIERRNHWEKTSHALLVGAILHVLYAEADKTLAGVATFLSDPARPIATTLRAMLTTPHLETGPHPVVASAARELLNKSDNERSGVLSTAMSFLGLYRDPVVARVTRRCDWRIADLVQAHHTLKAIKANKSDQNDARGLAQLARTGFYKPTHVKSLSAHAVRALLAARKKLVGQRVTLENQIRGLAVVFGARLPRSLTPAFKVQALELAQGVPGLATAMRGLLDARDAVLAAIAAIDRDVRAMAKASEACRLLTTVPGVGPITALAFAAAIDDPARFRRSREVGAYLGLTPRRYQSGETDYNGSITKQGDTRLRTLLYEAASVLLTRTKAEFALKDWARDVAARSSARKARVALARRLAVIMHAMLRDRTPFHAT